MKAWVVNAVKWIQTKPNQPTTKKENGIDINIIGALTHIQSGWLPSAQFTSLLSIYF